MIQKTIDKYYYVFFTVLLVLCGILCFYKLGYALVENWDEARHGVNAYEMMKNQNYLVNTYGYHNDYWNVKPPLSFWSIIGAFKIFGVSVVSMRLYSAVSMFLLVLVVGLYLKKRYGSGESLLAMAFLLSYDKFFYYHMARTGDADALFTLLFTVAILAMLEIPRNPRWIYAGGFAFALAFLTKGWHAMLLIPIAGLFLLFTGEIKRIRWYRWPLFLLTFAVPIGGWVFLRYQQDGPLFFKTMIGYDLFVRSVEAIEGHVGGYEFYVKLWAESIPFLLMIGLLIAGLVIQFRKLKKPGSQAIGFMLWILLPFIAFNLVRTKIEWYLYPVIVPIMMASAILIVKCLKQGSLHKLAKGGIAAGTCVGFILGIGLNVAGLGKLQTSPVQELIKQTVSQDGSYTGMDAYIQTIQENYWEQGNFCTAELAGDLNCIDGGAMHFFYGKNCLLFIDKKLYTAMIKEYDNEGIEIIGENEAYYALINHKGE